MHLAFSQLAASSYARRVFRQYSVENGRLDSASGAVPNANIMPQAESSLYDILKKKYKGRKGLLALQESGLTWGDVETIKQSVKDDMVPFEAKLRERLEIASLSKGDAFDFAAHLTVTAFSSQTPSPAADLTKEDASQLSASVQDTLNGISNVLLYPSLLKQDQYRRHFKPAVDCFNDMGWQIGVSAYTAGVRDSREDAIAYIVAGILLRDGLRAHLKEEKVFCEAIKEEEAAVKNIVNVLEERIKKHTTTSDHRVFDTFLAVSASPGMGKSALINLLCQSVTDPEFISRLKTKVISAIDQFSDGTRIPKTIDSGFTEFVSRCGRQKIYVCATTFNGDTPAKENILGLETNLALRALFDVANLPEDFEFLIFQQCLQKRHGTLFLKHALKVVQTVTDSHYVILATDELMNLNSVVQNPKIQLAMISDCFIQPQFEFLFSSLLMSPLNTFSIHSGYRSVIIPLGTLTQIKAELITKFAEQIASSHGDVINNTRFLARSILAASQYHGRTLESLWKRINALELSPTLEYLASKINSTIMDVDYEQTRNALLAIAIKKCTDASMTPAFATWQSLVSSGTLISHTTGKQFVIPMISLFCLLSEANGKLESLKAFRDIVKRGPVRNGDEFEHFVYLWEVGRRELIREMFADNDKMTLSKLYRLNDVGEIYRHSSSLAAWDTEIEMWRTMNGKFLIIDRDGYHVSNQLQGESINYNVAGWSSLTDRINTCYFMKNNQAGFDVLSYFKIKDTDKQVVLAVELKSNLETTEGDGQEVDPDDAIDKIKKTSKVLSREIDKGNEVFFLMLCSCDTTETIKDMFAHQISNTDMDPTWKVKLREYSTDDHFKYVFQRSIVFPRAAVNKLVGPSLDNLLYDPANK